MSENLQYYCDQIRGFIWAGFADEDDVASLLDDYQYDPDTAAILSKLEIYARKTIEEKKLAEKHWPETTDCDRLDHVFLTLGQHGIIALQNAGFTMSDGRSDVADVLATASTDFYRGYCFYHGQDTERALDGEPLWLAFGSTDDNATDTEKIIIARSIVETFEKNGFSTNWPENPDHRIAISGIQWMRRTKWQRG